jgi:hypothetical protein
LSCVAVIIVARVKKSFKARGRFSACCVALSCAIISATLTVVFLPSRDALTLNTFTVVYYCIFLALGMIAGRWYTIALPIIVLAYLCYGLWASVSLTKLFPNGGQHARFVIHVESDSLTIAENTYNVTGESILVFESFSLPPHWLVPFHSRMFRFAGVSTQDEQYIDTLAIEDLKGAGFSITHISEFSREFLVSRKEDYVIVPAQDIFPVQYVFEGAMQKHEPVFTLTKVF